MSAGTPCSALRPSSVPAPIKLAGDSRNAMLSCFDAPSALFSPPLAGIDKSQKRDKIKIGRGPPLQSSTQGRRISCILARGDAVGRLEIVQSARNSKQEKIHRFCSCSVRRHLRHLLVNAAHIAYLACKHTMFAVLVRTYIEAGGAALAEILCYEYSVPSKRQLSTGSEVVPPPLVCTYLYRSYPGSTRPVPGQIPPHSRTRAGLPSLRSAFTPHPWVGSGIKPANASLASGATSQSPEVLRAAAGSHSTVPGLLLNPRRT